MRLKSIKYIKLTLIIFLLLLIISFILFSRMIPSFGLKIIKNDKKINYLYMSDELYLSQTFNDCAPYSVMCVINILKGEIIDPNILVKETGWRIMNNLTFPQGAIDLLHKYKIKTKEYSLKLYSADDKIMWLKNKIDNGNPIILLVKDKSVQHFFTVIGYDETGFMLYDSIQEKIHEYSRKTIRDRIDYMGNRYYTNEELIRLWNNGGYKIFFRNWAVVCY